MKKLLSKHYLWSIFFILTQSTYAFNELAQLPLDEESASQIINDFKHESYGIFEEFFDNHCWSYITQLHLEVGASYLDFVEFIRRGRLAKDILDKISKHNLEGDIYGQFFGFFFRNKMGTLKKAIIHIYKPIVYISCFPNKKI